MRYFGGKLSDLLDLVRPDTGRTDAHALAGAVHQGPHRLQVQVPPAVGDVMGVADLVAELGAAATYFANSCHKTEISLDSKINYINGPYSAATRCRLWQPSCVRILVGGC